MLAPTVGRIGDIGLYASRLAAAAPRPPKVAHRVWIEWSRTMRTSLLPVLLVTGPFGMVTALQGLEILKIFGTQRLLSSVIALAILRELAPVLSAMMLAAQAGSAAAAEIASLKVTEQWDALEAMATPARKYVAFPRVAALTLAAPVLSLLGAAAGIAGGYLVEVVMKGFPSGVFFAELTGFMRLYDIAGGTAKALVFGLMAGLLACYWGEDARGGARGVGIATNRAVVTSVAAILVANYLLSTLIFGAS